MTDLIGTTIGNYRIESLVGTGGMGQVYRGIHLHLHRPAAIKVMHSHLAGDPSFQRRFRQEARSVAALSHPHIVQTWDFGTQDGNFYLVMELLTDGSLRSLLASNEARQPGWTIDVGLDLVRQAAEGLAYAHNRGMVHRDIKPDNLLIQRRPEDLSDDAAHDLSVKITDFGLARLTEEVSATGPSLVMGTPAFMSPELCQGLPLDGRSDIYSLGVVLYQVATGRLPFESRAAAEAAYKHVHAAPPHPAEYWPEIPTQLAGVILRCLEKNPADRFQTASELARALRAIRAELLPVASQITPATGDGAGDRTPSPIPPVRPLPTPRSAAVAHVIVSSAGGSARQVVELGVDGLLVGSLPDNDLVLGDDDIFGRHLRIDWDGEQASVVDLGSSSGTTLGGETLAPHVSRRWDPADELRLGTRTLRLELPGSRLAGAAEQTVGAAAIAAADDDGSARTVAVNRGQIETAGRPRSLHRRLPVVISAAFIAALLSLGGYQALSSGGDSNDLGGGSVAATSDAPTATTGTVMVASAAETPEPTATASPTATSTREPTHTATATATATSTPTPEPTATPAPTATPQPPPPPTATPVPPTPEPQTPTPAPSPEPTEVPATEEATAPAEPTEPPAVPGEATQPPPEATEPPAEEPGEPTEPSEDDDDGDDGDDGDEGEDEDNGRDNQKKDPPGREQEKKDKSNEGGNGKGNGKGKKGK